jgi:hypothetical protein
MKNDTYLSRYSNNKPVSAAQFITEIICERKALSQKEDLHYRFWIEKKWASFYSNQIGSAHKLLKKYSSKAIVKALGTDVGKRIYSLRAPHLPAIIEQQEALIASENKKITLQIERNTQVKFGASQNNNNIISKLKDLE